MTIKANIMFSLGVAVICCLTILSFNSCKEDSSTNDRDTSSEVEKKIATIHGNLNDMRFSALSFTKSPIDQTP